MPLESQTSFNGGINTRSPAHLISQNQASELKNVDLSFQDLRGELGFGPGGQGEFYYEKGNAWISTDGFSADDVINSWPTSYSGDQSSTTTRTITSNTSFFSGSPNAVIGNNVKLVIGQFTVSGQINGNSNRLTTNDVSSLKIGNSVVNSSYLPSNTIVTFVGTDHVLLNNQATATSPNSTNFTCDTIVTIFSFTSGIHGVNSYVEYNEDLYLSRSEFTVTGTTTSGSKTVTIPDESYKIQVGDKLSNPTYINEGSFVVSINTSNNTLVLSEEAKASTPSAQVITVKPIISKFVDGNTNLGYRASAARPVPSINFLQEQDSVSGTNSARDNSHSAAWYSVNGAIPFQYGISYYDETGVESGMSELTDQNIGIPGGSIFTSSNNKPQYLKVDDVLKYSSTNAEQGRFALYRVGGSSAVIKRVSNLYLDTNLSVSTTVSTNNVTLALATAQNANLYKVKWYSYGNTNYRYYNASTGFVYPFDSTPGATPIYSTTGETEYINPTGGSLSFQLQGDAAIHTLDIVVFMKIPGETVEREYVCRALTHNGGTVSNTGTFDFIDWIAPDGLIDIQPIEGEVSPERGMSMLIEVSNIFFASKDNRLYASEYGNPNSWPEFGFLDFDRTITGLGKFGSELIVFTEYELFRVFGASPTSLRKVPIPTTEGVPSGLDKCIVKTALGLMYVSHDGVCVYNGQNVQNLTKLVLDLFTLPNTNANSNNVAGYKDGVYYLFGSDSTDLGYKIDIRNGIKVQRTEQYGTSIHYRGSDNTLYSNAGTVDNGSANVPFTTKTREFVGGDKSLEKYFSSCKIVATDFSGTIEFYVDDALVKTFTVSSAVSDFHRTLYLDTPAQGNGAQIRFVNCTGKVTETSVSFEPANQPTNMLFSRVAIKYVGSPTVKVLVDNTEKIAATALPSYSGPMGEAILYFPAMTTGKTPHLVETNNESSGRVVSFQFTASDI